MADEQEILFREIDEELKQENLQQIWKRYGRSIIGASILLIAGVACFKGWQSHELNNRIEFGERFDTAVDLITSDDIQAAENSFRAITEGSSLGYTILANFQIASLAGKRGDPGSAIKIYKKLADDERLDMIYRDLATILGAYAELETNSKSFELIERADQLALGMSPWRFSAKEIRALAAFLNGDKKTARARYKELIKEAAAPQGIRDRAQYMLDLLGN